MAGISLLKISTMRISNPMLLQEMMGRSPIPVFVQYIMMYLGMSIILISGFAILKGKNWGRSIYIVWSVISLVVGIATTAVQFNIIRGIVGFLIITFFLFRPKANEYFKPIGIS